MTKFPTFDEWYAAKYGMAFEDREMQPGAHIASAMRFLSRELREYTSEAVASLTPKEAP